MNINAKSFENLFTIEEINALRQDQHRRPVAAIDQVGDATVINKNLDYHVAGSTTNDIIRPKLNQIIGHDHEFSTGCYKETCVPYQTHTDSRAVYEDFKQHHDFSSRSKYDCAVLIPLNVDPEFRTVFFNIHSDDNLGMGEHIPEQYLTGHNELDLSWFDHMTDSARKQIPRMELDLVWSWKIGGALVWPRSQLHSSTNYAKFGLCKRFVIMFIA